MSKRERQEVLGINRRNLDLVFADYRPGQFRELDDKIQGKVRLERGGVAVPRTIGVVGDGRDLTSLDRWLREHDELVIKPARGWGGRGILVLARDDAGRWRTPGGRQLDDGQIGDHVREILIGAFSLDENPDQALIEERIHAHAFLTAIYPRGLADLRIVLEDGEPLQAMLRVPTDASDGKANLHGGGLGLGIDLTSGEITHAVQGNREIEIHPDTGVALIGARVPRWDECLAVARAAAGAVDAIRYLGVDIVIDAERGPLVLEVNARPGLGIQIANQTGQPVRRRTALSRFDQFTQFTSWGVLALLFLSPWLFLAWQQDTEAEVRAIRAEQWTELGQVLGDDEAASAEWADQALTVSEQSETFARARTAAAAGDTVAAIALYQQATLDTTVAPFALNNLALIERSSGRLEQAESLLEQAIAGYPDYARGHYNLGLIYRDRGRPGRAEASFRQSLARRPGHAGSWTRLGELLLARDAVDSARTAFLESIRHDPDRIGARRQLARVHRMRDEPGLAATYYAQVLALSPDNTRAVLGWVDARLEHAARAERPLATATLDSLAEALGSLRGADASTATRVLVAEIDWWAGRPLLAWEGLREIPLERFDSSSLTLRAVLALELGLWDEVDRCLQTSASPRLARVAAALTLGRLVDPDEAPDPDQKMPDDALIALAWRVATAQDPGDTGEAMAAAVDAVERDHVAALVGEAPWSQLEVPTARRLRATADDYVVPVPSVLLVAAAGAGDIVAAVGLAAGSFRPWLASRFEAALADLHDRPAIADTARQLGHTLLRLQPDDGAIKLALIDLDLAQGEVEEARWIYDKLDEATRARPDARRLEGRLWLAEDRPGDAVRRFSRLVRDNPRDPELWSLLAVAQERAGRERDARDSWTEVLQLKPDAVEARERLARLLMDGRAYRAAAEQWQRVLALTAESSLRRSARFNLALALQRTDRFEAAVVHWDSLLVAVPNLRSARFNRALALANLGRVEDAIAGFESVLAIDPDHPASLRHLQSLQPEGTP